MEAKYLTDDQMMRAIKSVCGFNPAEADQFRSESLIVGRAVERAVLDSLPPGDVKAPVPLSTCAETIRDAILRNDALAAGLALGLASLAREKGFGFVALPSADGYGETDFGYTFAGINLTEGDKRLMSMLVRAVGTDHPAIEDMTALLFRSRSMKDSPA